MDVVEVNFVTALAILREHLPSANFVSFDLEFTGLGEHRPSQLDTPQVRYNTAREDASAFPPIQFGLCLFRKSRPLTSRAESDSPDVEKNWESLSFNFNLFPRAVYYPPNSRYPLFDKGFKLQSSTVMFLIEHGFDFQKSFRDGVTWLREDQEREFFKLVVEDLRVRRQRTCDLDKLNAEEGMLLKEWSANIDQWLAVSKEQKATCTDGDAAPKIKSFMLPSTPWMRKIICDLVRLRYPRMAAQTIPTQDGNKMLKLSLYPSEKAANEHYQEALEKDARDIIFRASMFRHVVDELRLCKKPIVMHNGLMDLTKLYANFIGMLPSELNGFKKVIRENFPVVFDTKRMVDRLCIKDEEVRRGMLKVRGVSEILTLLRKVAKKRNLKVVIRTFIPQETHDQEFAEMEHVVHSTELKGFATNAISDEVFDKDSFGFGRYLSHGVEHEAGHDALETGLVFTYVDILGEHTANELSLSFCGGFRCINLGSDKDEENSWFNMAVIIVKGIVTDDVANGEEQRNGRGKARFMHTVEVVTKDTKFRADQSDILLASKDVCIVILNTKSVGKRKRDEDGQDDNGDGAGDAAMSGQIGVVIENGRRHGVEVMRYSREILGQNWQWLSRTRMFA